MSRDKVYLKDVLTAMLDVVAYLDDMTVEALLADRKTAASIYWNLGVMGEATKRIPMSLRDDHPEIPWKLMAGMRDKLIHGYNEIDTEQVHGAVVDVIPPLIPKIEAIIASLPDPE